MLKKAAHFALAVFTLGVTAFSYNPLRTPVFASDKTQSQTASPSGMASFNYSVCSKSQKMDVLAPIKALPSKNPLVNAILVSTSGDVHADIPAQQVLVADYRSLNTKQVENTQPTVSPEAITPQVIAASTSSSNGGLNADTIFSMINQQRTAAGLPAFEKDSRVCAVTDSRAPELYSEITGGYMHAGFYRRNLPYWATENIIYMRTEQQAVNWWLNSPVHRAAIFGDYKYSCVSCSGNACSEIFTNFQPK